MNWIMILGWILVLIPVIAVLVLAFISNWVATLVGLGIAAMIAIGTFLIIMGSSL